MFARFALIPTLLFALTAAAAEGELTEAERQRARENIERDRPSLVTVSAIEFAGRTVTVRGSGTNPNAIAQFVENLKHDPLFTEPEVGSVSAREGTSPRIYDFDLRVTVR